MVIAPPTSIIYVPNEDGVLLALVALAHEKKTQFWPIVSSVSWEMGSSCLYAWP